MSACIAFCNKVHTISSSQEPLFGESVVVNDIQTPFVEASSGYNGIWDVSASSEKHEITSELGKFECPAFSESYRVIVKNNRIQNAAVGAKSIPIVLTDGTFEFESESLHTIDSFVKYKVNVANARTFRNLSLFSGSTKYQ